ncbi:MAG: hypothetical protein AAGK97_06100, partial [Bacteroidota bacterium]
EDACQTNVSIIFIDFADTTSSTCIRSFRRTFFGEDDCGNTNSLCEQTIAIEDTQAPMLITCTMDTLVDCTAETDTNALGLPIYEDQCMNPFTITIRDDSTGFDGLCTNNVVGIIERTFFATDICGNVDSSCVQLISLQDTVAPIITCPSDTVIICDGDTSSTVLGIATATDNCSDFSIGFSDDVSMLNQCGGTGDILRTWSAVDACGNERTCVQTITLIDTVAPTALCKDIVVTFTDGIFAEITTDTINDGSFDNCTMEEGLTFALSQTIFDCNQVTDTAIVILTVTDECGNSSNCTSIITFEGSGGIEIACPQDIIVQLDPDECRREVTYEIDAKEVCGNEFIIEQTDNTGFTSGSIFEIGTTSQSFIAFNEFGDSSECSFNVIIEEFENDLVCNDSVNVILDGECKALVDLSLLVNGLFGCEERFSIEIVDPPLLFDGLTLNGSMIDLFITYNVTNLNTGVQCQTIVTVEDDQPPVLTCGTKTIDCNESIDPLVLGLPGNAVLSRVLGGNSFEVANIDVCGNSILTFEDRVVDLNCAQQFQQVIYRTWTAEDRSGNLAECVDTIFLRSAPLSNVVFPPNYDDVDQASFDCNSTCVNEEGSVDPSCSGIPTVVGCQVNIRFEDNISTDCDDGITIQRRWIVEKECTNERITQIQIIKVRDSDAPSVTCPADITVGIDPWRCLAELELPMPLIEDNCSTGELIDVVSTGGNIRLTNNGFVLSNARVGNYQLTYIVADECGNEVSCTSEVTVFDDTPPIAVCDESITISLGEDGQAKLSAETFDHSSLDCSELYFKAKRVNNNE